MAVTEELIILAEFVPEEAEADVLGPEHLTKLINKNFAGVPTQYNPGGRKEFTILFPEDVAEIYASQGWNVNIRERDDGMRVGYLKVDATENDKFKPLFVQVIKQGNGKYRKNIWTERTIAQLDSARIKNVRLRLRPYNYTVRGQEGVKAYLSTMYFELIEDPFDAAYDWDPDDLGGPVDTSDTPW